MRKIYLIMAAMIIGVTLPSKAVNIVVNETCASWFEGYEMTKLYDFVNWTINGEPLNDKPDEWTMSSDAATFKVANWSGNGQTVYPITSENLTHIYVMNGDVRPRETYGIFNFSGGRTLSFADLKAGMIIVAQGGSTNSKKPYTSTYVSKTAEGICIEITDSIMAIQNAVDADGDGEPDGVNDGLRYFKMLADGRLDLVLEGNNYISAYGIIADASAAEFVSAPSLKLVGVAYDSRNIELKAGESSRGNEVTTWYSVDGSSPIFMEDTEEIARYDTIYVRDELGAVIDSTDYTVETIFVQKPVFDEENSAWGDRQYYAEDGAIEVSSGDDEDGDGYITVKVASITEAGVMSDIVEINVSVGYITLNQPTLTLIGLEGTLRKYQLGWANNTLCGEEFFINAEIGEGDIYEGMQIGDVIASRESIAVTVSADGYEDGVLTLNELDEEGVEYVRKNATLAEADKHDWDFDNLTEEQEMKIRREIIDYAYVVPEVGDTIKFYAEDGNWEAVEVPDTAIYVYHDYNWWYDSGNGRATLNVQIDTIWAEDGTYTTNAYYKEETIGLFHSGLTIDCPPNAKNNSCILIYTSDAENILNRENLGLYFLSKGTISISSVQYGEYVLTNRGSGGSNYTNSRWTDCDRVPLEGFTKSITSGSHIFSIDVYTTENLPDAIDKVVGNEANYANVYSIDGRIVRKNVNVGTALNGLHKGFYIMNGKKYFVQ